MKAVLCIMSLASYAMTSLGQQDWLFTHEQPVRHAQVVDLVRTPVGHMAIMTFRGSGVGLLPMNAWLAHLEEQGNLLDMMAILPDHPTTAGVFAVLSPDSTSVHVGGVVLPPQGGTGAGFFHVVLSIVGEPLHQRHYIFDDLEWASLENVLLFEDGRLLLPGSGKLPGPPFPLNAMVFAVSSSQADSLAAWIPESGNFTIVRNAALLPEGKFLLSMDGGPHYDMGFAWSRIVVMDDVFNYVEGVILPSISGDIGPPAPPSESVFSTPLDMVLTPDSMIIVSGDHGLWSAGRRAGLIKLDGQGDLLDTFLPWSGLPHDLPAYYSSVSVLPDDSYYFAMHEGHYGGTNFYNTHHTNRIRVYRLDPSLNILCEFLLDGAPDGFYYALNRIRSTAEGGFILIGSRGLVSSGQFFHAWAQKFPPEACQPVGIAEHEFIPSAHLYPNPGTEGFTVVLNGPVVHGGTLQLFDAQGRLVGNTPVQQSSARFDARGLAPGVYLYRISDAAGQPRGSGKWVRE